jgi:hypothetical protein
MNRRRFLTGLAGVGALFAGLPWLRSTRRPAGLRAASAGYDRSVSGSFNGFTVPSGELWKIDGEVESTANVIVEGTLVMRPGDTLRFPGIDEHRFVGGGMTPLDSDTGLWVIGDGVLDIEGTPVEAWNRTGVDPTWGPDHEIVLMPWKPGDSGWDPVGDVSTIQAYDRGASVPEIVPGLPTEVVNLSRDVVIEGTPQGRAHVFIHSTRPQKIRYATIRHVGPRQRSDRDKIKGVTGRYGLHFHMMRSAAQGSLVEGVVIRDCGNHAFVPHASHGVTFRRCVAFDTFTEQFWWDQMDPASESNRTDFTESDDIVYEECLGALVRWDGPGYHGANFLLNRTKGGAVIGCVAVASQGWKEGAGFHWPSQANFPPNVWTWKDNLSHNHLKGGFRVWQNTQNVHEIPGLKAYNCGEFGIANGAYGTPGYRWSDFEIVGLSGSSYGSGMSFTAGIVLHAVAASRRDHFPSRMDGYRHSFERGLIRDAAVGIFSTKHIAQPTGPTLIKDVAFEDIEDVVLLVDETRGEGGHPGLLDFVDCTRDGAPLSPQDVRISSTRPGFRARFQNDGQAWQIDEQARVIAIPAFYTTRIGALQDASRHSRRS